MAEKQYVVFQLEEVEYGVDIMKVKEISEYQDWTKVPNAPVFVEGIMDYRGIVTPVINLRKKLCLDERLSQGDKRMLIINLDEKQVAFIVDDASQVITIDDEDIDPTPELIITGTERFISGIGKLENRMIILLDLQNILNEDEKRKLSNL